MVPILLAIAVSHGLYGMEDLSTSPQKNFLGAPISQSKKPVLLSTEALQASHTMQCWLEVLENGMPVHPKISNPRSEFTEQLIAIAGPTAPELINTYHNQKDYSAWYTTLTLADLLTLCSALHYLESPLNEPGAFIQTVGRRVLERNSLEVAKEKIPNKLLSSVALGRIKKLASTPKMGTFKRPMGSVVIKLENEHRQNEILALTHSKAYLYSLRNHQICVVALSDNAPEKSIPTPTEEKITTLYCGLLGKVFAGTASGKVFDLSESSPRLIAQSHAKAAIKKIYAPTPSAILACTKNSALWKIHTDQEAFFEKEYTNAIDDCTFSDSVTKVLVLLSSDTEETKLVRLTTYGYTLDERIFQLKHARLSPDGKSLLGISSDLSLNSLVFKYLGLDDSTEETFFIKDSEKSNTYIPKGSNEAIIPWNGAMVGLPTLDLGFSNLGNFFYVTYGKGKLCIFNVHTGSFEEFVQNHAPVTYIDETDKELAIIRPTVPGITITTYAAQSNTINTHKSLDQLLLFAAIRYACATEDGLSLSSSSYPALYKEFLALSRDQQDSCKKYFGVITP